MFPASVSGFVTTAVSYTLTRRCFTHIRTPFLDFSKNFAHADELAPLFHLQKSWGGMADIYTALLLDILFLFVILSPVDSMSTIMIASH